MFVAVMGMGIMRVSAATTGMFLDGRFAFSAAATAVRFGGRALRKKLLPAMLAAKIKRLSITLGVEGRRFVHRHSADWVGFHRFHCRRLSKRILASFNPANAAPADSLHKFFAPESQD
jgi:hypothetical protein